MKLKHLIAVTLTMFTVTSYSQNLSMGPRLGGTLTKFGGLDNASYKPGLTAGVFLVYSKREHSGLGMELIYSGEGSKYEYTTVNGATTTKHEYNTRLNYLRVPFHATYFFANAGDRVRPKISLGPSVGFLMSAKQKAKITTTNNGTTTVAEPESTSLDNFSRLDIGLALSTGLNYKIMSRTWLNVDLRYYYGLIDFVKDNAFPNDRVNNQGASLSLGLAWGIDKPKN